MVYVKDTNQPILPTPFLILSLCLFLFVFCFVFYGAFDCISFCKFSRQLSAFSLCSPGLNSALLVLSTIHLFMKVSLSPDVSPYGLTFTWWGCYGLCLRHNPTELAHSFFLFFCSRVCFCLYMALSTVFHSINSTNNSPFSHSVLPVLSLPYRSFQLYISL